MAKARRVARMASQSAASSTKARSIRFMPKKIRVRGAVEGGGSRLSRRGGSKGDFAPFAGLAALPPTGTAADGQRPGIGLVGARQFRTASMPLRVLLRQPGLGRYVGAG